MALDNDDARGAKEPEFTELVRVAHAANLPEAELLKAELEASGIPAVIEGEGAGVAGIPDLGIGVPVLVPEKFAEEAAELIAEVQAANAEESDEDEDADEDEPLDDEEGEEPDEDEDVDDSEEV